MRFFKKIALVTAVFVICNCSGPLPVIGLDKKGNVVTYGVSEKAYIKTLEKSLSSMQETINQSMIQIPTRKKSQWQLQLISIGLSARADIGIGPIRMGINPGVRAFFSNQDNPPPLP